MGRTIGIDLGTTYSCVAIPEAGKVNEEGFYNARECPGCAVLQDKFKRLTTPSVVAENRKGEIIVGYPAKNMAGLSPDPIMFAKRSMGEDVTFTLDKQGTLAPEEVSGHILAHLKAMAEERLGEKVDQAVITVPAYFSLKAKQLTEKAGELAGLKVARIAQEPVAAAIAYCVNDPRDPLTILTYDLGGGTFDVAVLKKVDGAISTDSVMAFDGDRFLGGYNFDKKLALWLQERLLVKGYDLDPKDPVIFAKLLIIAEKIKIALSKDEYCEINEQEINITDRSGEPIIIQEDITREEFEQLIEPDIDETIELCRRALDKAGVAPEELDEIIMVGGSSRIPMIGRKLENALGKAPRLISPDLCVALGAAILAGSARQSLGRLQLDPIPAQTELPVLTITGSVTPGDDNEPVEGLIVTLASADGSCQLRQTTGVGGGFVFADIDLAPESITQFSLRVASPGGEEIARHDFSVEQTSEEVPDGLTDAVTNILAKPLFILLADGPHEIAPEKSPLPFHTTLRARTTDNSGVIRILIMEEHHPLGEIIMPDIPQTLEIGSSVEISLEIQENFQIIGRAFVPAIEREAEVVIDLPIPEKKSLEELRDELRELENRAIDVKAAAGRGALFAKVSRLDKRLADCREMLGDSLPDLLRIQDCLHEIESLIRELEAGWKADPPRPVLQRKIEQVEELLVRAIKEQPAIKDDGYDKQLDAIRKDADSAYEAQNSAAWKIAWNKLTALEERIKGILSRGDGGGASPPPDPAVLLMQLAQALSGLEQEARANGRYTDLQKDFETAADELKDIDPQAGDALARIQSWYFNRFETLRKKVIADGSTGRDDKLKGLLDLAGDNK